MLRSAAGVMGCKVRAMDGKLGKVKDLYFDDLEWTIRYLVIETGRGPHGKKVLLSPWDVWETRWSEGVLSASLTREQVEKSPGVEDGIPFSRRKGIGRAGHYGWPSYGNLRVMSDLSRSLHGAGRGGGMEALEVPKTRDSMRSFAEVEGYTIEAFDGRIGRVTDLIAETKSWIIRYLVIDTDGWLSRARVLLSPAWIEDMQHGDEERKIVRTDLTANEIEAGPEFDSEVSINRALEMRLFDHYGRPAYW